MYHYRQGKHFIELSEAEQSVHDIRKDIEVLGEKLDIQMKLLSSLHHNPVQPADCACSEHKIR